jgi:Family of unknown function (DUF5677)
VGQFLVASELARRGYEVAVEDNLTEIDSLRQDVRSVLDALVPAVEAASRIAWRPDDGFVPLLRRAILVRQFECLKVICDLAEGHQGFAAAPLLRPSCEEIIWLKYLTSLSPRLAERLVQCLVQRELSDNLAAQAKEAGAQAMKALGLLDHLRESRKREPSVRSGIADIGVKANWERRTVERGQLPTVSFLARKTGMTNLYGFLYQATSRYVHFSTVELLRRTWGRSGDVKISSDFFERYWARFALYWGLSLFLEAILELSDVLEQSGQAPQIDSELISAVTRRIGESGKVPLLTSEELKWEESGSTG